MLFFVFFVKETFRAKKGVFASKEKNLYPFFRIPGYTINK